ncbi:MAG: hypothetical protein RLP14_08345 [Owenweeksia sp.]
MKNADYQMALVEIISEIRDKATYLKSIDANNKDLYNPEYFKGMAQAYYFVMDGIKSYIESDEDLKLEDVGLQDFDPNEILSYKPS